MSLSVDLPISSRLTRSQKFIRVKEGHEGWTGLFKLQIIFAGGLFADTHPSSASRGLSGEKNQRLEAS